jgi:hypothetical protein
MRSGKENPNKKYQVFPKILKHNFLIENIISIQITKISTASLNLSLDYVISDFYLFLTNDSLILFLRNSTAEPW